MAKSNKDKVKIGSNIRFFNGYEGSVTKINENSVLVRIYKNVGDTTFPNDITVVNHKRYEILS